jgi:hypothetical protein
MNHHSEDPQSNERGRGGRAPIVFGLRHGPWRRMLDQGEGLILIPIPLTEYPSITRHFTEALKVYSDSTATINAISKHIIMTEEEEEEVLSSLDPPLSSTSELKVPTKP